MMVSVLAYHRSSSVVCASASGLSVPPDVESAGMAFRPLHSLPCAILPRLDLRRRCSNQFLVGEALADYRLCYFLEAIAIMGLACVVSERLFGQVPEQVEEVHVRAVR